MRRASSWLLLGFPILAYAPTLSFGFVYDDHWTILHNAALDAPLGTLLTRLQAGDPTIVDVTRPVMVLSTWIERVVFGRSHAVGYHAVSVGLHLACVVAASHLARTILRRARLAPVAAAAWSVLPVHAEAVSAINYREDLFATLGVLGVLTAVLAPSPTAHGWGRATCASVALALGLGGKESAVIVAVLIPALAPWEPSWWRRRERTWTGLGAVLGAYLAWRASMPEASALPRASLPFAKAMQSLPVYLGWTSWRSWVPVGSQPLYPPLDAPLPWAVVLGVAALGGLALCLRHRTRPWARAALLLCIAPLASSPWVGPINARADRYVYLGSLGAALLAVWAADLLLDRLKAWGWATSRVAPMLAGGVLLLACAGAASASAVWRDDVTLWTAAVDAVPHSAKAWASLGWAHRRAGDHGASQRALDRSLALDPDRADTWVVLGGLRLVRGDRRGVQEVVRRWSTSDPRPRGLERLERCLGSPTPARCIGDQGTGP